MYDLLYMMLYSGTNLFEDAITESEEIQKYDVPDSSTSEENDVDNDSQEETFENFFRQQRQRQKIAPQQQQSTCR